ncbi:MAG: FAD/NAD(P)-binding protein [Anaerolineales bacterium]|nr:FAD/NAD(P)-binding protein [Anaerolineales bacterium]
MNANGHNALKPDLARLVEVRDMAPEIKFMRVELLNGSADRYRTYQPGQFAFLSAFGVGEAPFGLASIPSDTLGLEFAVQRLGAVTTELHELGQGDLVGVRGPLGNCFPMEQFKGRDILVLGGGIGGAPLRPVLQSIFARRAEYGRLTILWAARRPDLLIFREEYAAWRKQPDTTLHLTVDEPDAGWQGEVGLITQLLEKLAPCAQNTIAITCGPPVMIYYADKSLQKLGFQPEQSYVTLEARMHCGIGKCGRCNLGEKLICVDGPVFSMAEVGHLLESFL